MNKKENYIPPGPEEFEDLDEEKDKNSSINIEEDELDSELDFKKYNILNIYMMI